jgi:hypothetical protein
LTAVTLPLIVAVVLAGAVALSEFVVTENEGATVTERVWVWTAFARPASVPVMVRVETPRGALALVVTFARIGEGPLPD